MSKKQKPKNKNKFQQNKKKDGVTIHSYAFFRALETIQLSKDFDSIVIVKGDAVLLPINLYKPGSFSFISTLENTLNPLTPTVNLHNKKLLIIRYGGMGDILASLFAISELKEKYPTLKVGYLTSSKNIQILKIFPNLIDYISQPIVKLESLKQFDYISSLDNTIENDPDSQLISLHDIYAKHLFTNITKDTIINVFKNNMLFNQKQQPIGIGIQYRSSAIIRNYDIDKMSNLIGMISNMFPSEPIFLLGPPNDYLFIEYILSRNSGNIIPNGCGFRELDILKIVETINNLKAVIGIDSAMLHIAGVCNIPTVGLFGPFPSNLRLKYYNNSIGIDGKTSCSPCFRHNPQAFCKFNNGQGECLNSISPDLILKTILDNIVI